jgi:hypothetical protein
VVGHEELADAGFARVQAAAVERDRFVRGRVERERADGAVRHFKVKLKQKQKLKPKQIPT